MLKKFTLIVLAILLSGCNNSDYLVALYVDGTSKDDIVAIFPSTNEGAAKGNCEAVVKLYKEDDKTNGCNIGLAGYIRTKQGLAPGSLPVCFCKPIKR